MASTHSNQNTVTFVFSFTFTLPIKLDRSNYTIWKSHIFYSVHANGLEDLLENSKCCPNQFLPNDSKDTTVEKLKSIQPSQLGRGSIKCC